MSTMLIFSIILSALAIAFIFLTTFSNDEGKGIFCAFTTLCLFISLILNVITLSYAPKEETNQSFITRKDNTDFKIGDQTTLRLTGKAVVVNGIEFKSYNSNYPSKYNIMTTDEMGKPIPMTVTEAELTPLKAEQIPLTNQHQK